MPHRRLLTTILTTTIAAVVLQQTHAAPPGRVVIRQISNEDGPQLYLLNQSGEQQPGLFQAEQSSRPIPQPVAKPISNRQYKSTAPAAQPIPYRTAPQQAGRVPARAVGHQGQPPRAYYPQPVYGATMGAGQPYIQAPLYPSPQPHIPHQVGSTMITSQALAPHEMLYAHKYRAMYGPYYYKVRGGWIVTPTGVRSHENWKLMGTEVKVDYKDHYPWYVLFSNR